MDTARDPHYTQPQRLDSCPYLGSLEDAAIHFGYPTPGNGCYRAQPIEPVRISYQDDVCLTASYRECPVFQNGWQGSLPEEIRQPEKARRSFYWIRMALLIIIAICALILVIMFGSQMLAGRKFSQGALNHPAYSFTVVLSAIKAANSQTVGTNLWTETLLVLLFPKIKPQLSNDWFYSWSQRMISWRLSKPTRRPPSPTGT
jgi:hypothetical protein